MTFNLFSRLILWLKKIFHIHPKAEYKRWNVEVTSQPKEESIKDAPQEEAKTKEKYTLKPRKPYKKKVPTEERKREPIKLPRTEGKILSPERRKSIYLGPTQRRRRRLTGAQRESLSDENIEAEIIDKAIKEKEFASLVESPFVEVELDNAEVYLILPKQQFKANAVDETLHQVSYTLNLNGKQREVPVGITTNRGGLMFTEEKRILLEEPLVKFQVAFPNEIQRREYNYNHNDKGLYAFVSIGSNRGRMYYLYDKEGKLIGLPKRDFWIFLNEDFELQTEPDVIEERWIWGKYQPFRIDLSEIDTLVIKNRISDEEESFALQSTYRVEGEQLIEDDYKKECPLFTGKTLKIVAPYENQSGWCVWIQNKVAGYKIKDNWIGRKPLTLRLPDDLPCEFGEFQIDICQQDTRIPDETLFFRFIPRIELDYLKKLIVPNPELGHSSCTINIKLNGNDKWELNEGSQKVEPMHDSFYQLTLPPEKDTVRFCVGKQGRPETIVNFQITIPRLKWKTSKQETWSGRLQKIERKHLEPGEPFYLLIQTNDFDNKYEPLGTLMTNGQKLQEGKFIRKGMEYSIELNQFYDTIRQNKDELSLKVEIQREKHNHLIDEVYILEFTPPTIRCKHISCNYETRCREEILSHFEKYHLRDLVEHLSYEEIREYDKSLPHKIYNCAYCNFYSCEDDPRNPTSIICWHIENECLKVDNEKGPPKISFRVVDDIDEIRQNVFPSLSHIYKCKLCGMHFKDYNNKAKVEHFFSKHENKICEY